MNLKNVNYFMKLRQLRLPLNQCLIVGSGTMALLGIKKNNDLDVWVTDAVYNMMKNDRNLIPVEKEGRIFYETKDGNFEASNEMPCTKGPVQMYLKRAMVFYGLHFQALDDVIAWKKCMNRPKDRKDLELINKYKKNKVNENYLDILKRM